MEKGDISNNRFAGLNTKKQRLVSIKIISLSHSYKHLLSITQKTKTKLAGCTAKLKPPGNHVMRTAETFKTG